MLIETGVAGRRPCGCVLRVVATPKTAFDELRERFDFGLKSAGLALGDKRGVSPSAVAQQADRLVNVGACAQHCEIREP